MSTHRCDMEEHWEEAIEEAIEVAMEVRELGRGSKKEKIEHNTYIQCGKGIV